MFHKSLKYHSPRPFDPMQKVHQHLLWAMVISAGLVIVSIVTVIVGT